LLGLSSAGMATGIPMTMTWLIPMAMAE